MPLGEGSQNVANNPIGSYPVKVTRESLGQQIVQVQHVNVDNGNQGLSIPESDYIVVTYPSATQEVYTYKSGGSGGTTVAVITVDYVDATKEEISTVAKT